MNKKTLVQVTEHSIVVAEEVVGVTTDFPAGTETNTAWVLMNGGASVPVPLVDGLTLIDVAARLFEFTEPDEH